MIGLSTHVPQGTASDTFGLACESALFKEFGIPVEVGGDNKIEGEALGHGVLSSRETGDF